MNSFHLKNILRYWNSYYNFSVSAHRNLGFTRKKAETHKSARKKRQIITRKNPIFEIVRVIASEIYAQKTEITKYARKPY